MKPDIPYVEEQFKSLNAMCFGGQLPMLPIQLSNAKTFLGQLVFRRRRLPDGSVKHYDYRLRINTRMDLPEEVVQDTILHEMIHWYIEWKGLKDRSAHGPIFRQIMNAINVRYGRHVSVSHKGTKEQQAQAVDQRPRYHVVAVVQMKDGRTGLKVLPRIVQRICHYHDAVASLPQVARLELYMTCDAFFNRYPNSGALAVHYVDREELQRHLVQARKMVVKGGKVEYAN